MPNIGLPELAIILVIVLLLFGASRLPKLGRSMGQGIKGFKEGLNEAGSDSVPEADKPKEIEKDSTADGSAPPTA
jgi:sec-independent protein translocase protein TatA